MGSCGLHARRILVVVLGHEAEQFTNQRQALGVIAGMK